MITSSLVKRLKTQAMSDTDILAILDKIEFFTAHVRGVPSSEIGESDAAEANVV